MSIKLNICEQGKKSSKGFTLIEVVLVIAILGLLSIIIVPDLKRTLAKYKLEVAAQELAQNIRLTQQKSITEGVSYKIVLDLNRKDNYQMLLGRRGKLIKLPSGVYFDWTTYSEVNKTLVFYPTGAPNRGGTIAIANGEDTLYVIISVATGRVRIGQTPP
ncbi:MAG: prepilin-type N-terminal cleavage/methylation domain-containing protein [Thermoanaerobacteraceae bacterium]|nr:prepilin-type N-terminal cleavage/methylation domain-containing protein [Thermoanaerobacteraceae bacterium]